MTLKEHRQLGQQIANLLAALRVGLSPAVPLPDTIKIVNAIRFDLDDIVCRDFYEVDGVTQIYYGPKY